MSNARNIASIAGEDVLNASNEIVPVYACRAWVNFDGADAFSPNPSTSAIRGYGNVSSIYQNGEGDYTINFATAMPDANYVIVTTDEHDPGNYYRYTGIDHDSPPSASSFRINSLTSGAGYADIVYFHVAVFR